MQHAWQHSGILGNSKGQDQQVQVLLKGQIILVTDIYHRGGGWFHQVVQEGVCAGAGRPGPNTPRPG
jgi:hypothetical protein